MRAEERLGHDGSGGQRSGKARVLLHNVPIYILLILLMFPFLSCTHRVSRDSQVNVVDTKAAELYNQGVAYSKKGQYDLAISEYTKAIEIQPYAYIYAGRGDAYYKKGQYDQAISDFSKAIEIDPKYADAYFGRGDAYINKGQYDQAISDFSKAIEIDPKYVDAYSNRGAAYERKGQYDQAISDCTKAIEIDPQYALPYLGRGLAYCQKGQVNLGLSDLNNAKKLYPNLKGVDEAISLCTSGHAQTKAELIVNFAYAPEKIRKGDIWKIYLSVTDPEGDMHRVSCRIRQQGGRDYYNQSVIYLKKGMEKQFAGYFALSTRTPNDIDDFFLEFSILDREGNERKTLLFPLEFGGREPMKPLPPDMEKDLNRRIGNFYINWDLAD